MGGKEEARQEVVGYLVKGYLGYAVYSMIIEAKWLYLATPAAPR